ncbi:hypothetical protein PR048_022373 [Dryococelus australis]|uniref:Uncharacterized protein n=1 Tax=Dryococelus australis TaxID=614101 RepID=A0ABQ9H0W3_9NEOP|nr:hypothetical protein PR048_022373 [Dryococelus australis]
MHYTESSLPLQYIDKARLHTAVCATAMRRSCGDNKNKIPPYYLESYSSNFRNSRNISSLSRDPENPVTRLGLNLVRLGGRRAGKPLSHRGPHWLRICSFITKVQQILAPAISRRSYFQSARIGSLSSSTLCPTALSGYMPEPPGCLHLINRRRREVSTEQRRNARAGKTEDPRENLPTSGIVRHDSHMRKSGSDPAGNRIRFALVGGEQSGHYATAAPSRGKKKHLIPCYLFWGRTEVELSGVYSIDASMNIPLKNLYKGIDRGGIFLPLVLRYKIAWSTLKVSQRRVIDGSDLRLEAKIRRDAHAWVALNGSTLLVLGKAEDEGHNACTTQKTKAAVASELSSFTTPEESAIWVLEPVITSQQTTSQRQTIRTLTRPRHRSGSDKRERRKLKYPDFSECRRKHGVDKNHKSSTEHLGTLQTKHTPWINCGNSGRGKVSSRRCSYRSHGPGVKGRLHPRWRSGDVTTWRLPDFCSESLAQILAALNNEVLRADGRVKLGENGAAPECNGGANGRPREDPPTNGIVRHNSQLRKSGSDPAGNRTRQVPPLFPRTFRISSAPSAVCFASSVCLRPFGRPGGSDIKRWHTHRAVGGCLEHWAHIRTALSNEVSRADEGEMRREWSSAGTKGRGETGDPRAKPLTSGIVRHDSYLRKSGVTGPGIDPVVTDYSGARLSKGRTLHIESRKETVGQGPAPEWAEAGRTEWHAPGKVGKEGLKVVSRLNIYEQELTREKVKFETEAYKTTNITITKRSATTRALLTTTNTTTGKRLLEAKLRATLVRRLFSMIYLSREIDWKPNFMARSCGRQAGLNVLSTAGSQTERPVNRKSPQWETEIGMVEARPETASRQQQRCSYRLFSSTLKAVHDKVSTFDINLRKVTIPASLYFNGRTDQQASGTRRERPDAVIGGRIHSAFIADKKIAQFYVRRYDGSHKTPPPPFPNTTYHHRARLAKTESALQLLAGLSSVGYAESTRQGRRLAPNDGDHDDCDCGNQLPASNRPATISLESHFVNAPTLRSGLRTGGSESARQSGHVFRATSGMMKQEGEGDEETRESFSARGSRDEERASHASSELEGEGPLQASLKINFANLIFRRRQTETRGDAIGEEGRQLTGGADPKYYWQFNLSVWQHTYRLFTVKCSLYAYYQQQYQRTCDTTYTCSDKLRIQQLTNEKTEKRDVSEKTRRSAASSGTIPTCGNLGATPPGIEPVSEEIRETRNMEFSRADNGEARSALFEQPIPADTLASTRPGKVGNETTRRGKIVPCPPARHGVNLNSRKLYENGHKTIADAFAEVKGTVRFFSSVNLLRFSTLNGGFEHNLTEYTAYEIDSRKTTSPTLVGWSFIPRSRNLVPDESEPTYLLDWPLDRTTIHAATHPHGNQIKAPQREMKGGAEIMLYTGCLAEQQDASRTCSASPNRIFDMQAASVGQFFLESQQLQNATPAHHYTCAVVTFDASNLKSLPAQFGRKKSNRFRTRYTAEVYNKNILTPAKRQTKKRENDSKSGSPDILPGKLSYSPEISVSRCHAHTQRELRSYSHLSCMPERPTPPLLQLWYQSRSSSIWAALNVEVSLEQRRNARAGETGDHPRDNQQGQHTCLVIAYILEESTDFYGHVCPMPVKPRVCALVVRMFCVPRSLGFRKETNLGPIPTRDLRLS